MGITILLIIAALSQMLVIVAWLWQHVEINRIRRLGPFPAPDLNQGSLPAVSVIIPARNEADRIGDCIASVVAQELADMRVLVMDDRSSDRTAEVALHASQGDLRIQVRRVDALPPGWGGKSHALWVGAKHADAEWLLFLDADARVHPGGIAAALALAQQTAADLLSLWPRDGSITFWERLLVPLCGAMIVIWYGRNTQPNTPPSAAFANGQFLLIRRSAYDAIGGHAAVRDALVEDIPLARLAQARGFRVVSVLGRDICTVRMYRSLGEIVSGWRRIYVGVLSPWQIAGCAASILIGSVPPYVLLPILWRAYCTSPSGVTLAFFSLSVAHLVALMATSLRFFSLARCRLRYLLLYPLSCLGVLGILAAAWLRALRGGQITWRDTIYRVSGTTIRH